MAQACVSFTSVEGWSRLKELVEGWACLEEYNATCKHQIYSQFILEDGQKTLRVYLDSVRASTAWTNLDNSKNEAYHGKSVAALLNKCERVSLMSFASKKPDEANQRCSHFALLWLPEDVMYFQMGFLEVIGKPSLTRDLLVWPSKTAPLAEDQSYFRFLNLPRELRDMVYHHVYDGHHDLYDTQDNSGIYELSETHGSEAETLRALLLTCSTIKQEIDAHLAQAPLRLVLEDNEFMKGDFLGAPWVQYVSHLWLYWDAEEEIPEAWQGVDFMFAQLSDKAQHLLHLRSVEVRMFACSSENWYWKENDNKDLWFLELKTVIEFKRIQRLLPQLKYVTVGTNIERIKVVRFSESLCLAIEDSDDSRDFTIEVHIDRVLPAVLNLERRANAFRAFDFVDADAEWIASILNDCPQALPTLEAYLEEVIDDEDKRKRMELLRGLLV